MASRPNILLITTDEQRYDTYGTEQSEWPQPPTLARLRREGAVLTNAYSNCPICMPCRYSWVTGLYGTQTERGPNNGYDWPDYHPTMPQALQRAGYHTALIGKLHAFTVGTLTRHHLNDLEMHSRIWGFDTLYECSGREIWSHSLKGGSYGIKGCRYTDHLRSRGLYDKALQECIERDKSREANNGLEPYRAGVLDAGDTMDGFVINEMCRFIENYHREQPFFLHASFFGPHYPLDVPPEYFHRFRPEDMPPPRMIEDPGLVRRWQENRAMYMGLLSFVDELIGRLLRTVEQRGLLDNTIILMTTDHGDMLGDDNFPRKRKPHEGACRTPIMVRAPGQVPAGAVLPGLVESVDLPHAILDIAGLSADERRKAMPASPGISFWDYARQGGLRFRDSVLAEVDAGTRMVRQGEWKYIRFHRYGDRLYNLNEDPHELHNRIDDPACAGKLREMQELLIDRMQAIPQPPVQGKSRGDAIMKALQEKAAQ